MNFNLKIENLNVFKEVLLPKIISEKQKPKWRFLSEFIFDETVSNKVIF